MKESFFEYYPLNQEELSALWQDSFLVLDTNVLLNLYRFSEPSRKDILGILDKFNDKLWMPFQVGWEYHNNRETVIETVFGLEDILNKHIQDSFDGLKKKFNSDCSRNPYLSEEAWVKQLDKSKDSLIKFIRSRYNGAPELKSEDSILAELNRLYAGKVGKDFTIEEMEKIYSDGKMRYAASIPPGYKDLAEKKDKEPRHLYGDLIIWKEMIRKAASNNKNVFFVTEDLKEDWMRIVKGEKRGPRWELMREFYDETKKKVVIMSLNRFAEFIHKLPDIKVKTATINEVKAARKDEIRNASMDNRQWDALYEALLNVPKHAAEPSIVADSMSNRFLANKLWERVKAINKYASAYDVKDVDLVESETPGAGEPEIEEDGQEQK